MNMPFISIFTPTYNRGHLLTRVYNSLCRQNYEKFEWIIVDDGSTDGTLELVESFKSEANFQIVYKYQKNKGKHVAINLGVSLAKGELFAILDSDDWLENNSLKTIGEEWGRVNSGCRKHYSGLVFLYAYSSKCIVGTEFPKDRFDSNSVEIRTIYGVKGDNFGVLNHAILRKYPFPNDLAGR